jgi:ribonucleoside-diphosphate reductase alpha chain
VRRRLEDERESVTHKFTIAGQAGYLIVGLYPDGQPGELFIRMAKEGSTLGVLLDQWAMVVSIGLQTGVPLRTFTEKCRGVRFEPAGLTGNPDIPMAGSPIDYIARWLGRRFVEEDGRDDEDPSEGPGTDGADVPGDGNGPRGGLGCPEGQSDARAVAP